MICKNTVNQSPLINATNRRTFGHMTQANHPLILEVALFNVLLSLNIPKYVSLELHATKVLS